MTGFWEVTLGGLIGSGVASAIVGALLIRRAHRIQREVEETFALRASRRTYSQQALFEFVSSVVSIFGTYLLLARFLAVRGLLRGGRARFWHYLGAAILSTIGVVLGLFLLFVPGIMLLVRWSAASGFVIGGGESVTGSLSASWEATRGHGWAIFFAALLMLIGITACAGVAAGIVGQASPVAALIVSAFVEAASGGVLAAFGIAVYCLVNDDAQDISEVFA